MRSDLTPSERSLRARVAAHTSWANTSDPSARSAPGRRAFLERFERQVDPDGTLPELERKRRAEHARRAYFSALALKSAQARRTRNKSSNATTAAPYNAADANTDPADASCDDLDSP